MTGELFWNGGIAIYFVAGAFLVVAPFVGAGKPAKGRASSVLIGLAAIGYGTYGVFGAPWSGGRFTTVKVDWDKVALLGVIVVVTLVVTAIKARSGTNKDDRGAATTVTSTGAFQGTVSPAPSASAPAPAPGLPSFQSFAATPRSAGAQPLPPVPRPQEAAVPAGWYPEGPGGRLRWWDGAA